MSRAYSIHVRGDDPHQSPLAYPKHVERPVTMRDNDVVTLTVRSGPWTDQQIRSFLTETVIPIRLASNGKSGLMVQSLWYLLDGDDLWCCTQSSSVLARRLAQNPDVAFEISPDQPPYRGVRGRGVARVLSERAPEILPRLLARYLVDTNQELANWLLSRLESEVAVAISDLSLSSWDFRTRMHTQADTPT